MHATRPFTSRVASGALKLLIKSLCTTADNLHVDIDAVSNRAFLSGRLTAVSVTASRIVYNKFSISGGAALSTDEICLLPRSLPFPLLEKPFSVSVRATLTEADLDRPGPARDALQHLLRQIISTGLGGAVGRVLPSDIGGITCFLEGVELDATRETSRPGMFSWLTRPQDAGGKIVLHTRAVLADGRVYTFAVRTGLTTISDGNVVKFSDPELLWRNLAFPLLTIDMIGVKLSPTTKLTNIEIDKGTLSGDGIIVIPPPSDLSRTLSSKESNAAAKASKNTRLEARRISGRFGL